MLLAARLLALPVSLFLIVRLTFDAEYRADNIFAVPDYAFSLLLVVAAFLPRRAAVPLLTVGFYFGAGVITVATFERFDQNEPGAGVLDAAIAFVYLLAATGLALPGWRAAAPPK